MVKDIRMFFQIYFEKSKKRKNPHDSRSSLYCATTMLMMVRLFLIAMNVVLIFCKYGSIILQQQNLRN